MYANAETVQRIHVGGRKKKTAFGVQLNTGGGGFVEAVELVQTDDRFRS